MSKVETTSKVSLELITRMNLGRRGARAKVSILDIVHKLQSQSSKGYPQVKKDP